jgi:diacylglycerol kinase family enzyme
VVNGVMNAGAKSRVGLIAQGTGGDFRKTLGLEHRLDEYLKALSSGRVRKIDVGKLRYRPNPGDSATRERWFVNILSAGMGGLVDRYVADAPSFASGKSAYFAASVRALLTCKEGFVRCRTTLAGKEEQRRVRTYMIAICNGRYFGGGMKVAPMAELDDGKFEVVSMGAESKLAFAVGSSKIYSGKHLDGRHVEHWSCDAIDLDLENEDARSVFLIDVDGEPLGGLPLSVELHKGAIELQA